jgi:hypothetical protein
VSGQGTDELRLACGPAQFDVRIVMVGRSAMLASDHRQQMLSAQSAAAQQRKKVDELLAELPRKAGQIDYDDMNTRHIDLFRKYHQALEAWSLARRQADLLRGVGPFHVAIRARTGAVAAIVAMVPPR